MEENIINNANMGIVKISDEVVSVIAGVAAAEINGVVEMNTGLAGGITQILSGKKNLSKGVKVNVGEDTATIDISVIVQYGMKIPEIAAAVQENVKRTVESMTGLSVAAVNIFIQGIVIPKQEVSAEISEE